MPPKDKIVISIQGSGVSFSREIDQGLAGQIIAICLNPTTSTGRPSSPSASALTKSPLSPSGHESVAEYFNRHSPKRNPDKILALAGHLKHQGRDSFHPNDIKGLFRDVGEVLPANFTRDFRWTQTVGWITQDPEKRGNYYITNTGVKVLDQGFPKDLVNKSKFKTDRRRARKKKGAKKA